MPVHTLNEARAVLGYVRVILKAFADGGPYFDDNRLMLNRVEGGDTSIYLKSHPDRTLVFRFNPESDQILSFRSGYWLTYLRNLATEASDALIVGAVEKFAPIDDREFFGVPEHDEGG